MGSRCGARQGSEQESRGLRVDRAVCETSGDSPPTDLQHHKSMTTILLIENLMPHTQVIRIFFLKITASTVRDLAIRK